MPCAFSWLVACPTYARTIQYLDPRLIPNNCKPALIQAEKLPRQNPPLRPIQLQPKPTANPPPCAPLIISSSKPISRCSQTFVACRLIQPQNNAMGSQCPHSACVFTIQMAAYRQALSEAFSHHFNSTNDWWEKRRMEWSQKGDSDGTKRWNGHSLTLFSLDLHFLASPSFTSPGNGHKIQ